MTETDELRGGLRELGVQYQACGDSFTMWKHDGKTATYAEYPEGGKLKAFVTPEQAIAATLGRGMCKPTTYDNYLTKRLKPGEYYEFWEPACACSECGELIPMRRFCPNCGARIEVDE